MKNLKLKIKFDDKLKHDSSLSLIKEYYTNLEINNSISVYNDDSGLDLPIPVTTICDKPFSVHKVNFLISCVMEDLDTGEILPYYIYPRSSIYKHPVMLANHVGIIDKNYRGNLQAPIRFFEEYTLQQNLKLFQICSNDLTPFKIKIVDHLDSTDRGTNGFGSTGL